MAELTEKKDLDAPVQEGLKSASRTASVEANEHQGINEKALLRKLDIRLLPPLTILYLLSFLDRSNGMLLCLDGLFHAYSCLVGNARLEGLTTDINMSAFARRLNLTVADKIGRAHV